MDPLRATSAPEATAGRHPTDAVEGLPGVAALLERAVAQGAFPGAAFGVSQAGSVVALQGVGRFTFDEGSPVVRAETSFDLASVTKVMATTAMAMLLWQRGRLDLETPLGDLLPGFVIGAEREEVRTRLGVTIRTLLAHSSGLPAHAAFFESCNSRAEVLRAALRLPLAALPGTQALYSDPGFILLGKALEVLVGEPLDRFCRREIFKPLGMERTGYWPQGGAPSPPTELDMAFRKRIIRGEVHDENCFAMGGVCGHAGLFAPVLDVLRFADAMLRPLRFGSVDTLFQSGTVRLFTERAERPRGSSRALGWDTPSGSPSSSGRYFSASSFGHLGYTGTSLWIDPVRDAAVVLLTNRTFPTRENRKIQEIRPLFHDAVMERLAMGPSA